MAISLTALRVELLGKLRLSAGERQTSRFETRRTALLLARLALPPLRSWPREELIEMLWPDEDPAATRVRFRQTLASLRRALEEVGIPEEKVLKASRATVELNVEQVVSDVVELESCLRRAQANPENCREALDRALELHDHHLLPGFYETWVLSERDRLSNALRDALIRLSQSLVPTSPSDAVLYARRAVALNPLSEVAQEQLLRVLVQTGQQTEAARHWKEVERLFWKELRTLPSSTLKAILHTSPATSAPSAPDSRAEHTPEAVPEPLLFVRTLPTPLDRFFGRNRELAQLHALLSEESTTRLITLTGPPGVGKTRLALEVGRALEQENQDRRLIFVPLEAISRSDDALEALLVAAGGHHTSDKPLPALQTLLTPLQRPLIVLDNAEGVVGLVEPLHRLLQGVPQLCCLVTSQQALRIPGEHELVLEPLAQDEGVALELLVDRAQRIRPGFAPTEQNQQDLAALCQELDGLPLALELAAGWLGMLSPEQVRTRLKRDQSLLVRRPGETTTRHASLHAALEASLERLTPSQQAILMRLAIFRGGWTFDAAEAVCDDLSATAFLDLDALRTTSLISAFTQPDGTLRFKMLETVRAYAHQRQTPESQRAAQESHLRYFCQWAEALVPYFDSPEQYRYYEGLTREQENLQAAIEFAPKADPLLGARLAVAFGRFWERRGQHELGVRCMEALLAALPEPEVRLLAPLMEVLARVSYSQLRYPEALDYYRRSQACYESLGDTTAAAFTRCLAAASHREVRSGAHLPQLLSECQEAAKVLEAQGTLTQKAVGIVQCGVFHIHLGEHPQAQELLEKGLALHRIVGNQRSVMSGFHQLAFAKRCAGDLEASATLFGEAMQMARHNGDDFAVVIVLWNLYGVLLDQGNLEASELRAREGLTLSQQLGATAMYIRFLYGLGLIYDQHKDVATARGWMRQGVQQADSANEVLPLLECAMGLVRLALREACRSTSETQQRAAAHLWGALGRLEELLQPQQQYDFGESIDTDLATLEATLGTPAFTEERERSRSYNRAAAIQVFQLYPLEEAR